MQKKTNKVNDLEDIMKNWNIIINKKITTKGIQDDMYTWMTYELPESFRLILYDVNSEDKNIGHDTYVKAELVSPKLQINGTELSQYANIIARKEGLSLDRRPLETRFTIELRKPDEIMDSILRLRKAYESYVKQQEYGLNF